MSVVVAQDYLTQRGGAERVALVLARELAAKEIVTSAYVPEQTFEGFADFTIRESSHAVVRALRSDPRRALAVLARAWDRMQPVSAEVVVCSSSGWAHGVPVTQGTKKVVYCHNPARWLYQPEDYLTDLTFVPRAALRTFRRTLIEWDQVAAASADVYIANSSVVASRIRDVYGIIPEIIHPPVAVDVDAEQSADATLGEGFFLSVGRSRGYKGVSHLVKAFDHLPDERLVIVGVKNEEWFPQNVIGVGRVSEARLRWLYASARALISVSREDFGLTPIEANAFGTPSLVVRYGGFLDSTDEGVSGLFIPDDGPDSIAQAVREYPASWDRKLVKDHARKFSTESFMHRVDSVVNSVI